MWTIPRCVIQHTPGTPSCWTTATSCWCVYILGIWNVFLLLCVVIMDIVCVVIMDTSIPVS